MKRNICSYIVIVFIAVFTSCSNSDLNNDSDISIVSGYDNELMLNGTGLKVEDFKIIPLEQTSDNFIDVIKRVELVDSLIIVQTTEKLMAFDSNGKFVRQYGEKGNGAEEYLSILSFIPDRGNKTIIIIDESLCKVLTFGIDGNYMCDKKYDREFFQMWANAGVVVDENNILFSNMLYNDKNSLYTIVNLETVEKRVLHTLPVKTNNTVETFGQSPISSYRGL